LLPIAVVGQTTERELKNASAAANPGIEHHLKMSLFKPCKCTRLCGIFHALTMKKNSLLLLACLLARTVSAATVNVSSLAELERAIAKAVPGEHIVMAYGSYTLERAITITNKATFRAPITIEAQAAGGVEIKGRASFALVSPAVYVVIEGFKFTGTAPLTIGAGVTHCRVTRNTFEMAPEGAEPCVKVAGDDNEIDCNDFENSHPGGMMLSVQGPEVSGMAKRTWIHHNYFYQSVEGGTNSCALQVGHSARSLTAGFTQVEFNLFVQTPAPNQVAISNESSENTYRFNTFAAGAGELLLRHGDNCMVYGNFFMGSEGVLIYGKDHKVYDNYFEACLPAIRIGNGNAVIPPGDLTKLDRPSNVQITFNTLVNNLTNVVMASRPGGLGASNVVFADNIVMGGGKAVSISGPLLNAKWEGNIVWNADAGAGDMPATGYVSVDPQLKREGSVQYHLESTSPAVGKAVGPYTYVNVDIDRQSRSGKRDVGADEYSSTKGLGANHVLARVEVGPDAPASARNLGKTRR
jgi:poly(beta-D-mannuronate) lyase